MMALIVAFILLLLVFSIEDAHDFHGLCNAHTDAVLQSDRFQWDNI